MGFQAIERNELGDTLRAAYPCATDDAACARTRIIRQRVEKSGAVIPREPYPGDIGSHSPFLRIGDRTTLDQHIHTCVCTHTNVYVRGRPAKIQISHRDTRDFKHNLRETTAVAKARRFASIIELYGLSQYDGKKLRRMFS